MTHDGMGTGAVPMPQIETTWKVYVYHGRNTVSSTLPPAWKEIRASYKHPIVMFTERDVSVMSMATRRVERVYSSRLDSLLPHHNSPGGVLPATPQ
jgi:hypothetical protein